MRTFKKIAERVPSLGTWYGLGASPSTDATFNESEASHVLYVIFNKIGASRYLMLLNVFTASFVKGILLSAIFVSVVKNFQVPGEQNFTLIFSFGICVLKYVLNDSESISKKNYLKTFESFRLFFRIWPKNRVFGHFRIFRGQFRKTHFDRFFAFLLPPFKLSTTSLP